MNSSAVKRYSSTLRTTTEQIKPSKRQPLDSAERLPQGCWAKKMYHAKSSPDPNWYHSACLPYGKADSSMPVGAGRTTQRMGETYLTYQESDTVEEGMPPTAVLSNAYEHACCKVGASCFLRQRPKGPHEWRVTKPTANKSKNATFG
uniref:Uncharacterized protein n=1 Tax=Trichuris muris TaxID=70415 RepID=A0A5S6QBX9_TRIMR